MGTEQANDDFVGSPSYPGRNISHLRKTKACLVGVEAWVCSKALLCDLSTCPSWPVIKIDTFFSCMRNIKWLYALLNSNTFTSLAMDPTNLQGLLSVMIWIAPTNSRFLLSEVTDWGFQSAIHSYFCNHHWTHTTLFESFAVFLDWHPNILKSSYWHFQHYNSTACLFKISGGGNCIIRQCPAESSLLHGGQSWKKVHSKNQ